MRAPFASLQATKFGLRSASAVMMLAGFCWVAADASPSAALTVNIGTNFTGTDHTDAMGLGFAFVFPPDTMGAVGPSHIAEIINSSFAVYDKTGALQGSRVLLDSFWNTAFANAGNSAFVPSGTFDPRILYDANTSRWYAVAADSADSAASRFLVGVTTGSDPSLSNWRAFEVDADSANTRWADFPTLGINGDTLYTSANMFDATGGIAESTTVNLLGVPLSSLTSGTPSITGFRIEQNIDPNNTGFAFQPAVDMDAGTGAHVGVSDFNSGVRKRTDIPSNWITSGSNIPAQAGTDFAAQATTGPSDADQPGAFQDINTGDRRFSGNVVLQNGSLWGVQSVDNGGLAAIRWYEFIDSGGQFTIAQTGLISDSVLDLYFPSIAVNASGIVAIGFTGSSNSTPPSTYFAVGETISGTTTFNPIVQSKLGNGSYVRLDNQNRNRWGDYSATVVDPSDSNSFWTFQEFVDGADNWAVQITQINIGAAAVVPEPASLLMASLLLVGLSFGRFRRR